MAMNLSLRKYNGIIGIFLIVGKGELKDIKTMTNKEVVKYLVKIKNEIINNNLFKGIPQSEDRKLIALDKAIEKMKEE